MAQWSSGYVSDIPYFSGFYAELNPNLLGFASFTHGIPIRNFDEPLSVCELGCGQGVSANVYAAADPTLQYHAIDFNPAHIAAARRLAAEAGAPNIHFHELAFAELAATPDLPRSFDIISLHGVYSWISAENRQHIVSFISSRLKPGGLVYVSYNALPGWASAMPLRRLFVDAAVGDAPLETRIKGTLAFAQRFVDANPKYVTANPGVKERLEKIRGQNVNYLAHEYFNRDWRPFYHAEVSKDLAEAKLGYLGSAHLLDHIDSINLSAAHQAVLAELDDSPRRETLRDYIVNQQFRRDIFVKGKVPVSQVESRQAWLAMRFALSARPEDVPLTVKGALGDAGLHADIYAPLLKAFAPGPRVLREVVGVPELAGLEWGRLTQALAVLVGAGHLQPAMPKKNEEHRLRRATAFNKAVMARAKFSAELQVLASPVTGGGIAVDRIQQLFLLAQHEKHPDPVSFAWDALRAAGHRVMHEGKVLEAPDENIGKLKELLEAFSSKRLPVLRQLGIA